jgi:hypothetical protein
MTVRQVIGAFVLLLMVSAPAHPQSPAASFEPAGEPPEHPGVALMFLRLLDAAEGPPGGVARLLRVHAPRDVLILEKLQVRADLAGQLPFGAARSKRRQQAPLIQPFCSMRTSAG